MFRIIESSIMPNTKHSTGIFNECTHYGIQYCLQNYIDVKDNLLADVFK